MSAPAIERFAGTPEAWDAFVASRPEATHAHRWAWRGVVERAYGHACPYLAARGEDGRLRGVLPLVLVRGGMGRHLVSMPYLNAGGPLGDVDASRALAARAAALAAELGCGSVELRCRTPADTPLAAHPGKVTCVLALPPEEGSAAQWAAFPAKLRSQVRRAGKEGVEVRFGADQVEPFFRVFARNMRDLGAPTHPAPFFRAVAEELANAAWFAAAWLRGRPVAGGCAVVHAERCEMVWASALREASPAAPNMLLYWEMIRRAADAGLREFDFGRCTPGGSTHRFKRQWGAADLPLAWVRAERRPGASVRADAPAFALARRLWRHLPVPVATLLGPRIRRGIPL